MTNQELLLQQIRKKTASGISIIDIIASTLEISYDAAHRRVALKSRFSIDETIALCRHFSISMDGLFSGSNNIIAQKTAEIRTAADMETYLKQSAETVGKLTQHKDAKVFYSAKDLPLFYTIGGTLLSKFKLYVWLNLLSGNNNWEPFEKFTVSTPLQQHGEALKKAYDNAEIHEIWNDTTINSSLQQIHYYHASGLLSATNALHLLNDVTQLIQNTETRCTKGKNYNLYYNELLILTNNVLICTPEEKALFVPYTMLGYFITNNGETCHSAHEFFSNQIKNSMALHSSGTRERKIFFNRCHQKINSYRQQLEGDILLNIKT